MSFDEDALGPFSCGNGFARSQTQAPTVPDCRVADGEVAHGMRPGSRTRHPTSSNCMSNDGIEDAPDFVYHRPMTACRCSMLVFAALLACALPARAQAPSASAPAQEPLPAADPRLEQAKQLFRQGTTLLQSGDHQRALEYYMASRAIVPSVPNTLNAAICLDRLGRYDEALELYEELLTKFQEQVTDEIRREVAPAMAALRRRVASLDVSANVEGTLIVDGRMRGKLPLLAPVRVIPGTHQVRVVKDGYETFEQAVTCKAGEVVPLDARLKPLTSAGRLRVEAPGLEGADLYVDGAMVGTLPWEGTLSPAEHLIWVRKGDTGCAPRAVVVLQGQTVRVQPAVAALGPELRIVVEPASAMLWIDGTAVGKGLWQGRLPIGQHTLDARELGYHPASRLLHVTATSGAEVRVILQVDSKHARWGVSRGQFRLEALGGLVAGTSLGSGPEQSCGSCSTPLGWMGMARGEYELAMGLGFEVGAGFLSVGRSVNRTRNESFPAPGNPAVPSIWRMHDEVSMHGPAVSAGLAWRLGIGTGFHAQGRVDFGVWIAQVADLAEGEATAGGVTREVRVHDSGTPTRTAAVFLTPGIQLNRAWGGFHAGLRLAAAVVLTEGPRLANGSATIPVGTCDPSANPESIDCSGDATFTKGERSFGRFVVWIPHAVAGYSF